jgi:hypothetical protein
MTSSVGMITFPTEWKNRKKTNHHPDYNVHGQFTPSMKNISMELTMVFIETINN